MKQNKVFAAVVLVLAIGVFAVASIYSKNTQTEEAAKVDAISEAVLVKAHSYVKGSVAAKVTLVEFLDPECESCRAMHPINKQILSEFGDQVRFVIRYMPLHGNSILAASALEEARELGKFEEALDILFEKQPEWGDHHNPRPELIKTYLEQIGMKPEQLDEAYLLGKHSQKIEIDQRDGYAAGVMGTPTYFVNGKKLGSIGYEPIRAAIVEALK